MKALVSSQGIRFGRGFEMRLQISGGTVIDVDLGRQE
jgi:hypothetical protein